jgi:hypothetical protein
MTDMPDLQTYFQAGKAAIDLLKSALLLLPKGAPKEDIERKIHDAEQIMARADA